MDIRGKLFIMPNPTYPRDTKLIKVIKPSRCCRTGECRLCSNSVKRFSEVEYLLEVRMLKPLVVF
jgi:hypothetical protein